MSIIFILSFTAHIVTEINRNWFILRKNVKNISIRTHHAHNLFCLVHLVWNVPKQFFFIKNAWKRYRFELVMPTTCFFQFISPETFFFVFFCENASRAHLVAHKQLRPRVPGISTYCEPTNSNNFNVFGCASKKQHIIAGMLSHDNLLTSGGPRKSSKNRSQWQHLLRALKIKA